MFNILRKISNGSEQQGRPLPVDVLTGYAHWAAHYPAEAHNPLMEIEQQAMLSLLPSTLAGQICLDLACGSGRYALLLHSRGAKTVAGLDYSANMLAQAAGMGLGGKLARGRFSSLPFPAHSVDLITCGLAVGHEQDLRGTLAEAARVLRPGGVLIYSDLHPAGALAGWRRTFTTERGAFELEHHLHLPRDHQRACQQAGLLIEAMLEPRLALQPASRDQNIPAVLVIRAAKA